MVGLTAKLRLLSVLLSEDFGLQAVLLAELSLLAVLLRTQGEALTAKQRLLSVQIPRVEQN